MNSKRLYNAYCIMRQRCTNPKSVQYKNYGGRGIGVCDEWLRSYRLFKEWALQNGYSDGLTIERIDVNGNYCPENCTWIPREEQSRNKTNTHWVNYKGKKMTLTEISKTFGIDRCYFRECEKKLGSAEKAMAYVLERRKPYGRCVKTLCYKGVTKPLLEWCDIFNRNPKTVESRIEKFGWSVEDALTKSARKTVISHNGETHSLKEWSRLLNIDYETLRGRFYGGWDTEKMLTTPKQI